jgi:hypothetical protein
MMRVYYELIEKVELQHWGMRSAAESNCRIHAIQQYGNTKKLTCQYNNFM